MMELRPSWTSMGRTPTGFKQHRKINRTTNYCVLSVRLRRSRNFFSLFSSIKTWTAVRESGVCEVPVKWKKSLFEFLLDFDMDIFINEFFVCWMCRR
ncbi:hypothetical protein TNCV_128841 [Trichonephila clavipes]|nr:hypothetical protein TNCV_128841 [Trichonephila clavipes]